MGGDFVKINGLSIFYRQAGSGPLLFLLHPSPRNSRMMVPLMHLLADGFTVVAPDLPGYGYSDKMPVTIDSLYDYLPYLQGFFNSFGGAPVWVYGTATGAQLGIAYGLTYPQGVAHLFLDNTAHFEEAQRQAILHNYFPDFTPRADGGHLQSIWQHVCDGCLYFPWYDKTEANRIAVQLPSTEVLQEIVKDYVLAGANYADAYKAAFEHERAEKLQQLTCPATIFKWMGSPLLPYINQLLQFDMPQQVQTIITDRDMALRYQQMKTAILQTVNSITKN
jgi:pimeloyl-ACP methyl ester carboxylesterase